MWTCAAAAPAGPGRRDPGCRRHRRRGGAGPSGRRRVRRASRSRVGTRSPRRPFGSRRFGGRAPASSTRHLCRRRALGSGGVGITPSPLAHSSKTSSNRSSFRSASEHTFRSPPEKSARPSRTVAQRPTSSTPIFASALRSSVVRAVPTSCGDGSRRARADRRPRRSVDPRHRTHPSTRGHRGRDRFAAAERARRPRGSPVAPIAAARPRAAHRWPKRRRRARPRRRSWFGLRYAERRQLLDVGRQRARERRHRRSVACPGRDEHRARLELALARRDVVAVVDGAEPR